MSNHFFIIDPQIDFCHPAGALFVPGADEDMQLLANLLRQAPQKIDGITVTLDSHLSMGIERTSFWHDADGHEIAPFTLVTLIDVLGGKYVPAFGRELVINTLSQSETQSIRVWPVHCVIGSEGHNVVPALEAALRNWETKANKAVHRVVKGMSPYTEHFGIFEADVPNSSIPGTCFNYDLAEYLCSFDRLFVAGEAGSHCVAKSVMQLLTALELGLVKPEKAPEIFLINDCMSPVSGYEEEYKFFRKNAAEKGVKEISAKDVYKLIAA